MGNKSTQPFEITVIKRDGRSVPFEPNKIFNAIDKAREATGVVANPPAEDEAALEATRTHIIEDIVTFLASDKTVSVKTIELEKIQEIVEKNLWTYYYADVARDFTTYRYRRSLERQGNIFTKYKKRVAASEIENSNANVDEASFSGREKEAASDVSKDIALNTDVLSKPVAQAHKDMLIYQHDLEKAPFGQHNCLFPKYDKLLANGFCTRNGDVRGANSLDTALQFIAVITQCQSQVQFGGAGSLHLDYDLAPYVIKSWTKHLIRGIDYFYTSRKGCFNKLFGCAAKGHKAARYIKKHPIKSIEGNTELESLVPEAVEYANAELEREGQQGFESLYHNLNTLESRQGSQVPFSSINLGKDTTPEGRLITKWCMQASLAGIGAHHRTSIFPISIFSYKKGVNADKDDPNYDLKRLALESLSKRIYPNFANCDWSEAHEDPNDPDTDFGTMGCRTLVGYDVNGCGYKRNGRGNNVPCTIILPQVAMRFTKMMNEDIFDNIVAQGKERLFADGVSEEMEAAFFTYFEEVLGLTEQALMERFRIIAAQTPGAAPYMYENGTIVDADKCSETVFNAVKHNTMAFGYIGIAEMCQVLFGENHVHNTAAYDFALKVVKRINAYAAEATKRRKLNFSCYATPAEGLCHNAVKGLAAQYGTIPGIFDRDYLTNSHHVPVWENVTIMEKLRLEAPFTKYATGGCITYIEVDSTFMENLDAVEKIIDYAFQVLNIPYLAFNFPIDTCLKCGHTGEFDDGICPSCGGNDIESLRRVTGYLNKDYRKFNKGKRSEVLDRVKHGRACDCCE